MAEAFEVEETKEGVRLDRGNVEGKSVIYAPGLCIANIGWPQAPRDIEWYKQNVIAPLTASKKIGDGITSKFDDRKFRIHSTSLDENVLRVELGMTHFNEYREYGYRTDEQNLALQEVGLSRIKERWAFFGRAPGISAMVVSAEGHAVLGVRNSDEKGGMLATVGGHWTYQDNISGFDLNRDLEKELKEEFGISPEETISKKFVGVFSDRIGGGIDFTYLAHTNKPDGYFTSGEWKTRVKEREHRDLVIVPSYDAVQTLLGAGTAPGSDERYVLMEPAQGALMYIKKEELAQ